MAWLSCACAVAAERNAFSTLAIDRAQTAGIDGRQWDTTFPGATTFDAVHRAVLVRFPTLLTTLARNVGPGVKIVKAEIVLDYAGYELAPEGYLVRTALGEQKWKHDPPRWHVVAWALRRSWIADSVAGPTFNASANGTSYWSRYGASDVQNDRHPVRFGPHELSHVTRDARIDITAFLTSSVIEKSMGDRVRSLQDNGVLLEKLETYDQRYRDVGDPYEWAVPVGGHGLSFTNPRVVLTLAVVGPADQQENVISPDTVRQATPALPDSAPRGKPTALMPSDREFDSLARQYAPRPPKNMPAWQYSRVMELYAVGGDRVSAWSKAVQARDRKQYESLVRGLLATPPRYWQGWDIQDDLLVWHLYRDLLPPYVQDHVKRYWESWLMPDVATEILFHPQSPEAVMYWQKTGDWRGRASFFRDGYNRSISTQNFNHTAAMGALIGGAIIGSPRAMADGRYGLEHYPLRLWAMRDGTTQEMLDHYYFSITLSAQKMFADFGPMEIDRLMGHIMLDRSIELLASAYHPQLRRIVNPSGRARLSGILVEQDGIYGVLHTLSRKGALNYLDRPMEATVHGMRVWGNDLPPGRVAVQSLKSKWAPDWVSRIVDDKTFPFEETSTDTTRGAFDPPLWRRAYLGRHYGLASQDMKGGTADLIGQWNHKADVATSMEDLGTLTLRYAINDPDMATTAGGVMPYAGGMVTFQHRNRAIVCMRPLSQKDRIIGLAGKGGLKSLAAVIALWNFRAQPGWEIRVDDVPITSLPAKLRAGQVITLKDGVTYVAVIPLPATDLGRSDEVVIGGGGGGRSEPNGAAIKPALTIASYNMRRTTPAASDTLDWPRITSESHGGFVIEFGDVTEYGSFDAFTQRMRSNQVQARWVPREKLLHVSYRSGKDLMEIGCSTDYMQSEEHRAVTPGQQTTAATYRRINGAWPYLPRGIDRDTTLAQMGTTGRLEKNGAVLTTRKGAKAYLQTEPISGTYVAYNPLPDPTEWSLAMPNGVVARADGAVGLLRVTVQPKQGRLWVDYAVKESEQGPEMARHLIIGGLQEPPVVERNGAVLPGPFRTVPRAKGSVAYLIPLLPDARPR